MSLKSIADTAYTLRFLRILTMPWEKTKAFKVGIFDINGKKLIRVRDMTPEQKSQYTLFHRLVFNLKRLIAKTGRAKTIASYAAALFLIKENFKNYDTVDNYELVEECITQEYDLIECININTIVVGQYILRENVISPKTYETIARLGTYVIIRNTTPVDTILGQDIFECVHELSNQVLYVPVGMLEDAPANSVAGGGIANPERPLSKKVLKRKRIPIVEVSDERYYAVVNRKQFNLIYEFEGSIILKAKNGSMTRLDK